MLWHPHGLIGHDSNPHTFLRKPTGNGGPVSCLHMWQCGAACVRTLNSPLSSWSTHRACRNCSWGPAMQRHCGGERCEDERKHGSAPVPACHVEEKAGVLINNRGWWKGDEALCGGCAWKASLQRSLMASRVLWCHFKCHTSVLGNWCFKEMSFTFRKSKSRKRNLYYLFLFL